MALQAIKYQKYQLEVLDQLLLPFKHVYVGINNVKDGWNVIKNMQVRGAPAIAIVGCLSVAVELSNAEFESKDALAKEVEEKMNYLVAARPTAVNIQLAAEELIALASTLSNNSEVNVHQMKERIIGVIEGMLEKDVTDNKAIGKHGADTVEKQTNYSNNLRILTHCNTGSLATAGYGTALGVIRSLHARNKLEKVFCTETRPYNQGSRLTVYELVYDNIPTTLICDDMVAALMTEHNISAVVVGADRVAANGDTANKIGTYQIAVLAKYHNVPFYVAAPFTSIDKKIASGDDITIEIRPEIDMTHIGNIRTAAVGCACWNPAFDVTPASLITAIITEKGVYTPDQLLSLDA